jgi:hypothetical protein
MLTQLADAMADALSTPSERTMASDQTIVAPATSPNGDSEPRGGSS